MYDIDFIAKRLKLIGKLLELKGENSFKVVAYYRGEETLRAQTVPIQQLIQTGELDKLKNIGSALGEKIRAIYETGTCPLLARLEEEIPEGVIKMLNIKGIGPKKVQAIWQEMGITSIGELWYACNENRLVEMKGFGAKTQETIRNAVEYVMANEDKFHYARLFPFAEKLEVALREALGPAAKISLSGEIRRKMPTLQAVELLVESSYQAQAIEIAQTHPDFTLDRLEGDTLHLYIAESTIPVRITFAQGNFWLALWERTGSAEHIAQLSPNRQIEYASEAEIYSHLGLQFIEPEMREDMGEIEKARNGNLPVLIEREDIRGMVHNHSTWSDGLHTLAQMAEACREMGMDYLGISDHSRSAGYAGGLSIERVIAQQTEIDGLNQKMAPFRIFKGIESDILGDGSLDYPDEVLATFDFVIASVHSGLNMEEEKATQRLIRAIENPYTTMLGHPTGRLLLVRKGYPINHRAVIDACAAHGVAIEINANPHRLDLDWTWVPYALEKGVMLSINPDAHRMAGYADTWWGIEAGRKGGLAANQCLNTFTTEELAQWFQQKKKRAGIL